MLYIVDPWATSGIRLCFSQSTKYLKIFPTGYQHLKIRINLRKILIFSSVEKKSPEDCVSRGVSWVGTEANCLLARVLNALLGARRKQSSGWVRLMTGWYLLEAWDGSQDQALVTKALIKTDTLHCVPGIKGYRHVFSVGFSCCELPSTSPILKSFRTELNNQIMSLASSIYNLLLDPALRWPFKGRYLITSYNLRECGITNTARLLRCVFSS